MQILLDHLVDENAAGQVLLMENVCYRPELINQGRDKISLELVNGRIEALVTRQHLSLEVARAWRSGVLHTRLFVITILEEDERRPDLEALGIVHRVITVDTVGASLAAVQLAERLWSETMIAGKIAQRLSRISSEPWPRSVAMVGAGVVNLVTALELARNGYDVDIYERAPDPRDGGHWSKHGCSWGGDSARMFTLTEADGYYNELYRCAERMTSPFDRPVSEKGWRISDHRALTAADVAWLEAYARIPPFLGAAYTDDILRFNRDAAALWEKMQRDTPTLFEDVNFAPIILRLYTDERHFQAQVARQIRLGAMRRVLTPAALAEYYPTLRSGAINHVVGGIEVVGFTLELHRFLTRLLGILQDAGVRFHWEVSISSVRWNASGRATGLIAPSGVIEAAHYVLSPGAYGHGLLCGTASNGLIHGVLGVWLTVPNLHPRLDHSLKIARKGHRAEDANVTISRNALGEPVLKFGSGYGWTGMDPSNIGAAELEDMYRAVEETIGELFPQQYRAAIECGMLHASRRFCVRPWTPSSLGVFEILEATKGFLVVTGGHNTGGFTQAPVVAEAVLAALSGQPHPMHALYSPERSARFGTRTQQPKAFKAVTTSENSDR